MADIQDIHKTKYGCPPKVTLGCPGKITISGEHTEYFDGVVVSSAINMYCYVSVSKRQDSYVNFYSVNFNESKRCSLSNTKFKKEDRWANYLKGVIISLELNGYELSGMDITIDSEIPMGIGLGSSGAMCLALVSCIKKLFNLDISWLNLVETARYAESVYMGLYTGLNEVLTMLFNKKDSALYLDTSTLEYKSLHLNLSKIKLLIVNPGVVNNEYARDCIKDRDELYELATKLSRGRNQHSLRNYSVNDIRSILDIPEHVKRRGLYIIDEIKRSIDFKNLVQKEDFSLIGRYLIRSHEGQRDMLEVTCPEVDWLIKRCSETKGVFGAKASGEMPWGVVLILLDSTIENNLLQEHFDEYEKIFGFTPKILPIEICDGMYKTCKGLI